MFGISQLFLFSKQLKYQFKIKIQFHLKTLQNPNVGSFDVSKYCRDLRLGKKFQVPIT
jgi:hypothetical protein